MALLFANNASSKLATGINNSVTSLVVTTGEGAKFPVVTGGNTFMVTVQDSTGAYEIMSCTARTTDTLTVTRAQESTTARAFSAGATVANRFTAGTMTGYAQTSAVQPLDATLTAMAGVTVAADKLMYATGADAFTTTSLTAAGRAILDDADAAAQRTTLGLAIGTNVQAYDADTMKSDVVTARTRAHRFTPVAVTSTGGALAIDLDLHEECTITLSEDTTVSAATNQASGKYLVMKIVGASTYTLAWNANYLKESATALPTAPAAGKTLTVCFRSDGTYMRYIGSQLEA